MSSEDFSINPISLKEIIDFLLYDWNSNFSPTNPALLENQGNFNINKTYITKNSSGEYFLAYKVESYPISNSVYKEFVNFYNQFYKNDYYFEILLTLLSNKLYSMVEENAHHDLDNKVINFNEKVKVKFINESYILYSDDFYIEVDESFYNKVGLFVKTIQNL